MHLSAGLEGEDQPGVNEHRVDTRGLSDWLVLVRVRKEEHPVTFYCLISQETHPKKRGLKEKQLV